MSDDSQGITRPGSYVLAGRDYADIVHLENPSVIERMLSGTRQEATAYVSDLLRSGISKYIIAGPKVAMAAITVQALNDFWEQVSEWRRQRKLPEDLSGRKRGYQSWVELLREIETSPTDSDRLDAMKAMFLVVNSPDANDGTQILAYQLFQISKKLSSGDLLVLKAAYADKGNAKGHESARDWLVRTANFLGHGATALIEQHERVLVGYGLLSPRINPDQFGNGLAVILENGRLTDLGVAFCRIIENYDLTSVVATG